MPAAIVAGVFGNGLPNVEADTVGKVKILLD